MLVEIPSGAVGFIDWLDLFGFDLPLYMVLKYPSRAPQQEADNAAPRCFSSPTTLMKPFT